MVTVKLYKGNVDVVGRESPYSLYNEGLATYAKGDEFDHTSAKGFIYVWGLPLKTVASAHKAKMKVVEQEPASKNAPKKVQRRKAN
jgi:argininosuccinate synthase